MESKPAKELHGLIDHAIVTIRQDEAKAVLRRLPFSYTAAGNRTYDIAEWSSGGRTHRVAHVRCREQGPSEARRTAEALIRDLAPKFVLLVGIAGTVPNEDVTLGDVVVSSAIYDVTVGANQPGGKREFSFRTRDLHDAARDLVSRLPAICLQLGNNWLQEESIALPRPPMRLDDLTVNGSDGWKKKVHASLVHHFESNVHQRPVCLVLECPFASGGELVKDPDIVETWLQDGRDIKAVEMELVGAYEACAMEDGRAATPLLSIRGISDVVGLKREPGWTTYACETAAAFSVAIIKHGAPPRSSPPKHVYGHPYPRNVDVILRIASQTARGQILQVLGPPGLAKSLLLREVVERAAAFRTTVWLHGSDMRVETFEEEVIAHVNGAKSLYDVARWSPPLLLVVDGFQSYFNQANSSDDALRAWPGHLKTLTVDGFALVILCGSIDSKHLFDARGLHVGGSWNLVPHTMPLKPDFPAWVQHLIVTTGQSADEIHRLATLAESSPVVLLAGLDALHMGNPPEGAIDAAHKSIADEIMHAAAPCCRRLLKDLAQAGGTLTEVRDDLQECKHHLLSAHFLTTATDGLRPAVSVWPRHWKS